MRLALEVALVAAAAALVGVALRVPRFRAAAGQLALLVVAALVALVVFTGGGGRAEPAAGPPLHDPYTVAGSIGPYAVGVGVSAEGDGLRARATVLGEQGPADGLHVELRVSGQRVHATPCGPGCYEARVAARRLTALGVRVGDRSTTLDVPARWPAPSATAIVRRATMVFRNLRAVTFLSRLGPTTTLWRSRAPNRLSGRELHNGSGVVIIGGTRWDRDSARERWVRSPQQPIAQPSPPWPARYRDARVLGSVVVRGRPAWRVSFVDPLTPSWFTIDVDKQSARTYSMRMIAQAHFMRETYSRFDEPTPIAPPTG